MVDKEEILTGIAIIVGLAVTCQLLAPKLRIPALVLLLPAGFLAGVVFPSVDPMGIFGSAFTPLVNIAVGLILFHGGLELVEEQLVRKDRRIIQRLIFIGSLITWACASAAFYFLLGVSSQVALLLGAIVIVSGPTVVGPLLDFVKPEIRIRRILAWEGTLIDPVGALIAVIVFQAIQASSEPGPRHRALLHPNRDWTGRGSLRNWPDLARHALVQRQPGAGYRSPSWRGCRDDCDHRCRGR